MQISEILKKVGNGFEIMSDTKINQIYKLRIKPHFHAVLVNKFVEFDKLNPNQIEFDFELG